MTRNSKYSTGEVVRFVEETVRRLKAENLDLSPALDDAVAERFSELTIGQWHHVLKAQGHGPVAEAARRWMIEMDRVTARLCETAHKAHPNFVEKTDGHWLYTGPGEMPSDGEVIEWFQMNHPTQADEIERGIEAEP